MKRAAIYIMILFCGAAALPVCPAFAKDGTNPSFMAIYLPQGSSPLERNTRIVEFAEQSINGVFSRKGFRVLDRAVIESVYKKLPKAGKSDGDLAKLAAQSKADVLLIYDVQAEKYELSGAKPYDNLRINVSLRAVSSATADNIAQKNCDDIGKIPKSSGNYQDNAGAAKVADGTGKCVAGKLVDEVMVAYINRGFSF